jgi:hypothetical protein
MERANAKARMLMHLNFNMRRPRFKTLEIKKPHAVF